MFYRIEAFGSHEKRINATVHNDAVCLDNNVNITEAEHSTDLAGSHYGLASFSFLKTLRSLLGSEKRGNLSNCGLLASLVGDSVHPTNKGWNLMVDMLTLYLSKAQKHYRNNLIAKVLRDPPKRLRPMHPQSLMVPRMECYGTFYSIMPFSPDMIGETGLSPALPLPVVNFTDGWAFVEVENNKRKPGWISNKVGSILKMAVGIVDGVQQSIGLTYLTSWKHMGIANMSCVQGCRCEDSIIEGHDKVVEHSIPRIKEVHFFPATNQKHFNGSDSTAGNITNATCVIRVKITNATSSGEHKFKVIQLSVMHWINVSDFLQ